MPHSGYRQGLHEQIMGLIAAGTEANVTDRPGGIFVRPADQISNEDRVLLQTVARAIISDSRGLLADQINRRGPADVPVPRFTPTRTRRAEPPAAAALPRGDLIFFNGLGGFTPDGRDCASISSSTAGMARGTAARISTTARRLGRPIIPNAGSIPLRKAGRCYPGRAMPGARAWLWQPWINAWFTAIMRSSNSWTRRSTSRT
jgi:hypothetical protein